MPTLAGPGSEALFAEASLHCEIVDRTRLEGQWMPVVHRGVSDKIYIPTAGRARLTLADGVYELHPGRVAIVPAGALQQGASDGDEPLEKIWVHFSAQTTGTLHLLRFVPLPRCIGGETARTMQTLAQRLEAEWKDQRPGRQLALKILLLQLLLAAYRAPAADHLPPDDPGEPFYGQAGGEHDEHAQTIQAAITLLLHHHARPLTLAEVASHVDLSPAYLNTLFSRLVGTPPMKFLESVRMRRAQAMLASGDQPVAQIARAVGYRDANYFSRAFARCTGVSPSAYRQAAQASGAKKIQP